MKILLPIHNSGVVRDAQDLALDSLALRPQRVSVYGNEDYWRALADAWQQRETFVVLEHDILPWPGAIESLWECDRTWCGFPYLIGGSYGNIHLGCTKFDKHLMIEFPNLWLSAPYRHWSQLDGPLYTALYDRGVEQHVHEPPVIHLNPGHFPKEWQRVQD